MTGSEEASFLRGWAITGVLLLAPGLVVLGWFMLGALLGHPSDAAFVAAVGWTYLLMPYFIVEPSVLPGAWGVAASVVQWVVVAGLIGVTTRRVTWRRALLLAGAAIVTAGGLAHMALRLFGHRMAFEGL